MNDDTRPRRAGWAPNADIVWDETHGALVVEVEAARVDPNTLRVSVEGRRLFVWGRRADGAHARCGTFLQKEIASGEFVKQLYLPAAVREEEGTATYADGMLSIRLPVAQTEYIPASRSEIHLTVKRILV